MRWRDLWHVENTRSSLVSRSRTMLFRSHSTFLLRNPRMLLWYSNWFGPTMRAENRPWNTWEARYAFDAGFCVRKWRRLRWVHNSIHAQILASKKKKHFFPDIYPRLQRLHRTKKRRHKTCWDFFWRHCESKFKRKDTVNVNRDRAAAVTVCLH